MNHQAKNWVSGNGWQYYPNDAEQLEARILEQADFMNISEVSRFASAMVKIVAQQQRDIVDLRRRIMDLEAAVGMVQ